MENISVWDKKAIHAMNLLYHTKRFWIAFGIIECSLLALAFLFFTLEPGGRFWKSLLIYAVVYPLMLLFIVLYKVWKLYRSGGIHSKPVTVHFAFREEDFEARVKTLTTESSATFRYSALDCAHDSVDYLFLMINEKNAYYVDKKGFTSGSAEELLDILRKNGVKVR